MRFSKRLVSISIAALLATAGFLLVPGVARATGASIAEFNVPTNAGWTWHITPGPDGAMWFTEKDGNLVGRIDSTGAVTEYPVPTAASQPGGIVTGPDGWLWFCEQNANKIGKMPPGGAPVTEYPLAAGAWPWGIECGPDGALWFTEYAAGRIGRITTAGALAEIPLPDAGCTPMGITVGPDGALWFCEYSANRIGRITTAGAITEYNILTAGGHPVDIAAGPDGRMWFTEEDGNVIGAITMQGGVTEYTLPTAACSPIGITRGPDGAMWFTEYTAGKIGRITTQGIRSEFAVPSGATLQPNRIAMGPDARLWFTESSGSATNKIGRATVSQPTWFLAEGSTAWGYSCHVTVENPNNAAVNVHLTYNTATGPVDGGTFPMPPLSQLTINPADVLGENDFSTLVNCVEGRTIAVDRTMTWTGGVLAGAGVGQEGHNSVGVTEPSLAWYLPEGSSNWGFETWLLIQNPNPVAATCTVTYMTEGAGPIERNHTVPAGSRATFNMFDEIGSHDASIQVYSDLPVIPERAMYRDGRREGHDSIGTTLPAHEYFLAEGTTAWGFTTFVLIQNPTPFEANVDLVYMTPNGPVPHPGNSVVMPAHSRKTIRVNDYLAPSDFSTRVTADVPVIAERAMYWYSGADEVCHDSIGTDAPRTAWYLPDGQSGEGHETWTLVQNPNSYPVEVEIAYMTPDGVGNVTRTETVDPASRRTFDMLAHSGISGRAAIMVKCISARFSIIVERAMYWNGRGAGTDTLGGWTN